MLKHLRLQSGPSSVLSLQSGIPGHTQKQKVKLILGAGHDEREIAFMQATLSIDNFIFVYPT